MAEAKRHFDQAVALFNDGDFGAALTEFEASYKIHPAAGVLYNIGLSQKALYRYDEALDVAAQVPRRRAEDPEGQARRGHAAHRRDPGAAGHGDVRGHAAGHDGAPRRARARRGADGELLRRRRRPAHLRVRRRGLQAGEEGAQGRRRAAAQAGRDAREDSDDGARARDGQAAARRGHRRRHAARAGARRGRARPRRPHAVGAARRATRPTRASWW